MLTLYSFDLEAAEARILATVAWRFKTQAAAGRVLGISRHAFQRRLAKHGIPWPPPRVFTAHKPPAGLRDLPGRLAVAFPGAWYFWGPDRELYGRYKNVHEAATARDFYSLISSRGHEEET